MEKQVLHMDYSTSRSLLIFLFYLANGGKLNEDMYYYIFGNKQLSEDEKARMLACHYRGFYSMLSMLTLYDEIVVYPVEGVKDMDEGLLDELGIHYSKGEKDKSFSRSLFKEKNTLSAEEAERIVRANAGEILSDFRQEKCYYDYWTDYDFNLYDSLIFYLESKYHFDILPSEKIGENATSYFGRHFLGRSPQNLFKTGEYDFLNYLDATFESMARGMNDQRGTFYSSMLSKAEFIGATDLDNIDNIVLAADYSSGLGVIPHPETIDEVRKWRNRDELKSFRPVFASWIDTMRNGEINIACKMKTDVQKANKQLAHLDKCDKIQKNAFVALIKAGLSAIPQISAVEMVADFITPYTTDFIRGKNNWVNLPAFNQSYGLINTLKRKEKEGT